MSDVLGRLVEVELAVRDVEAAATLFSSAFGTTAERPATERTPGLEITMSAVPLGGVRLGLIQDSSGSGPVARFIDRRGEGLYSLLVEVPDLADAMQHLRDAGIRLVSDEPKVLENVERGGETYSRIAIAWTHPSSTHGLLIELQERQK
jgi:methylmalonyl-CoA/ethylmalonyl-CoA epimerase